VTHPSESREMVEAAKTASGKQPLVIGGGCGHRGLRI
jgi:hypothetical protein